MNPTIQFSKSGVSNMGKLLILIVIPSPSTSNGFGIKNCLIIQSKPAIVLYNTNHSFHYNINYFTLFLDYFLLLHIPNSNQMLVSLYHEQLVISVLSLNYIRFLYYMYLLSKHKHPV